MIYCFGNSHAAIFVGGPPCGNLVKRPAKNTVQVNPVHDQLAAVFLGPIVAYNFVEHHLPKVVVVLTDLSVGASRDRDVVMLYVGEVDCRYHMAKRVVQGEDAQTVVRECVSRYYEATKTLKKDGWRVALVGAHPTTPEPHSEDLDKPHWGSWQLRNSICVEWNSMLAELCAADEVPFVNVYDKLVNEDNSTRTGFYVDYCHLSYKLVFPMFLDTMTSAGLLIP